MDRYRQKILVSLGILAPDGKPTARAALVKIGAAPPMTPEEWQTERERMISVCTGCHAQRLRQPEP